MPGTLDDFEDPFGAPKVTPRLGDEKLGEEQPEPVGVTEGSQQQRVYRYCANNE